MKRLESSVYAFRLSVERALQFLKTFETFLLDGRVLRSTTFHRALRLIEREGEEDSATPSSLAARLEAERRQPLRHEDLRLICFELIIG